MARDIATSKIALALSFKICPPVSYLCSANSIIPPFNILESPIKTKVASQMICILFQFVKHFWCWSPLIMIMIPFDWVKNKKEEKIIIKFQLSVWSSDNLRRSGQAGGENWNLLRTDEKPRCFQVFITMMMRNLMVFRFLSRSWWEISLFSIYNYAIENATWTINDDKQMEIGKN